jgi:hypothetical protein
LAMEGMSDADKQSLIEEQLKILNAIEAKKKSQAVSAADAFEQRSFSAAVRAVGSSGGGLHGPERTRMAMADGSAVTVRCAACDTLSQVTGAAQFMFCPTCQTVTPVIGGGSDDDTMAASDLAQMEADAQLAQELQKEEYESADRQEERRLRAEQQRERTAATSSSTTANAATSGGSWMDWLGLGGSTTPAAAPVARTSTEEVSFDHTRASGQTADPAPLFACVTDSINSAANYALSLPQDDEGNVHGVDSSSLLAVPQVGRNTNTKPSTP